MNQRCNLVISVLRLSFGVHLNFETMAVRGDFNWDDPSQIWRKSLEELLIHLEDLCLEWVDLRLLVLNFCNFGIFSIQFSLLAFIYPLTFGRIWNVCNTTAMDLLDLESPESTLCSCHFDSLTDTLPLIPTLCWSPPRSTRNCCCRWMLMSSPMLKVARCNPSPGGFTCSMLSKFTHPMPHMSLEEKMMPLSLLNF